MLYELSNRCFTAAVRAEVGIAVFAAGTFPWLWRSLGAALGTEIGAVLHTAQAQPFIAVPYAGLSVVGRHSEELVGSCHILKSHNRETVDKHKLHLTAVTLYSRLSCIYRRTPR